MNLDAMKAVVTSKFARQTLLAQKHSPKILFVAGTAGVITATVLACRATLKVESTLDKHENAETFIKSTTSKTESEKTKELNRLKVRTCLELAKPYIPAAGVGLVSIAALTGSHVILTKRNGAVMAAYATLDKAYKEYRERVADEYGADTDLKFATGGERVAVEEKTSDGKVKLTEKIVPGGKGTSPYAALFDEKSHLYSAMPGANANTLGMVQQHATDKLRARGHLFLNEVYDMLGLPRTPAGQFVGWVFNPDPNNIDHAGDNYVTFGIWNNTDDYVEAFMEGHERAIWLDFNVDGPIYELI